MAIPRTLTSLAGLLLAAGFASGCENETDGSDATRSCSISIDVSGAESFADADVSYSAGVVDRLGEEWVSIQANNVNREDDPYILNFFVPAGVTGSQPFYDADAAFNRLGLNVIDSDNYDAVQAHNGGVDAGTFEVTRNDDWLDASGRATLLSVDGAQIGVDLDVSIALGSDCP